MKVTNYLEDFGQYEKLNIDQIHIFNLMSGKDEDQKSVARSVSSLSTAANALTVVRFNPIDELLFASVYTLHKERPMSNLFYFIWLGLTFFNLSGIAVVWGKFPFHKNIVSVGHGIFQYLDFSISWSHDLFLLVMTIIFGTFTLAALILVILSTILVKTEKQVPSKLSALIRYVSMLMAYPFFMPSINVFVGGLNCLRGDGLVAMACDDGMKWLNLVLGLVMLVFLVLFGLLIRFFVFPFNSRKDGLFASQTGIFNTFVLLVSVVMPFLVVFLKSTPQYVCIAGLVLSLGLFLYAFFLLPFYSAVSNAVSAAVFADVAVFYIFGLIWSFVGNSITWLNAVLWVVWGFAFLGVPVGVFFGTRAYARAQWATRPGEPLPYVHKKETAEAPAILSGQMMNQAPMVTPHHLASIPLSASSSKSPLTPAVEQPMISIPPSTRSEKNEPETSLLLPSQSNRSNKSVSSVEMENLNLNEDQQPSLLPPNSVVPSVTPPITVTEPTPSASYQPNLNPLGIPGPRIQSTSTGQAAPQQSLLGQQLQRKRPSLSPQTPITQAATPRSPMAGQSLQSKLLSEQVNRKVPKYTNARQVQEAIKFLTEKECRKNRECISLADQILCSAQKKMLSSCELWICSAFFYLSHTNSQMKMGDCLRTANQCVPSLHERWVVFALMRDMERKTSAQGGQNSQGVSFKLNFAKATKAHDMSRAYLQQAYLLLSKENMDLDRIMLFLDKAIGFERDSRDVYQLLLRQYPNSAQVIRGYGALLRDIYRDDDTAMLMFTEANIIEEDTTVTETMSRVSGGSKLSSIAGQSSGQQKKKKKKRNHSGATLQLDEDKKALLPMFIPIVIMSGIVIVGAMVAMFVVVLMTFTACSVTTNQVSHFANMISSILDMVLYCNFFMLRSQYSEAQLETMNVTFMPSTGIINRVFGRRADTLGEGLDEVYKEASATNEFSTMEFEDIPIIIPSYNEITVGSASAMRVTETQVVNMNLIDLVNNIANVAALIINEGFWNTVEWPGLPAQLYYVIMNGPVAATEKMKAACMVFTDNSEQQSLVVQYIDIAVGVASIVLPLIVLIVQYVQTINKLKRERREVFFQIATARKDDVLRLKLRLDETEGNDEDSSLATRFGTTTAQSNTNTQGTNDDAGFNEEELELNSERGQVNDDEKMKMMLISQGMNPQMIAMMQMQGMSIQQIAEMMGKKNQDEEENEEDEDEKKNELKDGEKEETKSQKAKREAEEKKKAEEEEKEKKKKKDRNDLTPQQIDLLNKINKMSNFIPNSFYVRVVIGIILIVGGGVFFYLIAYFACKNAVKFYNSVILTAYKCVVAEQMGLLGMSIANSINYEIPGIYTVVPYAEGPWIDSRHLSSDMGLIQALLASEITYYNAIDILANQGSSSQNVIPTGDQIFDGLSVEPTMKKGSSVNALMFESTECMPLDAADCAVENRIYGLTGNFSGLQALILKHIEAARMIATAPNPYSGMPLSNENVQIMGSLLVYDLRGGFKMLLEAVISEMTKTISEFQILLIISFIVAFFLACVAFFAFIVPTKSLLTTVANGTEALKDIDPAADAADRTGMGQAAWKEEYTCDCLRFDHEHKVILLALAATCGCMDQTMEVIPSVEALIEISDDETKEILQQAIDFFMTKTEGVQSNPDDAKQKEKARTLLAVLALLVKSTFSAFADEEAIVVKYKVQRAHRRGHYKAHSVHLRKLQKETLSIAKFVRADRPVPTALAQNLIQLYTQWLSEHVTKVDRELSALLAGNAPESEMEREMDVLREMKVPHSYSSFLDSENASIQDQKLFEKMKHVLRIK
ncbi:hypothetical protein BLNAU_21809 [Blattamonas nauphoetae]|uniref:TmcB/TmcC TPR repeats domain-containing protein n=1 Tax=Blattamonas nauphoetae TaxID=2049346 RepID=A0ABQ9WZ44_9EUKA|nr:hypothetical protein BLNAU_21809 [Blattamonas nauphoetae]